ncbi:MAG: AAA family ATPase [bacterium]|nr:AAA family ATPase [bacterium]MDZ4284954.1 AAA family ATPase [Patescibacteria group bacterium]
MLPTHLALAIRSLVPVLRTERVISHARRRAVRHFSVAIFCVALVLVGVGILLATLRVRFPSMVPALGARQVFFLVYAGALPRLIGLGLIAAALSLTLVMLEAFYYSHYFRARGALGATSDAKGAGDEVTAEPRITFEAAESLYDVYARGELLARSFLASRHGTEVLRRLELASENIAALAAAAGTKDAALSSESTPEEDTSAVPQEFTLRSVAEQFVWADEGVRIGLLSHEITNELFLGAAAWVAERRERAHERERWWSLERLKAVGVVGDVWSYGGAYRLRRFAKSISHAVISDLTSYGTAEAHALESVLSRTSEANALLVGDDTIGIDVILSRLAARIASGEVAEALRHSEFFSLDLAALLAATGSKAAFEGECVRVFEDAVAAGNITLVIPSLPQALVSMQKLGVDFLELIDPYLRGSSIHVVATAHRGAFHKSMGAEQRLAERFEEVEIEPADSSVLASLLLARAEELERRRGVFFSFPTIFATAESARQYFPYGSPLDNAFDLLDELAARPVRSIEGASNGARAAGERESRLIRRADLDALVKEKTGIPVGEMGARERERLLSLEKLLGRRVLGQPEALRAVAEALRRARAGLTKGEKPMGSFLFLGPTGVGKTETSKALAAALFEDEKRLSRLDMSEFNTADAVERLIGSPDGAESGALATILRDQPYGVLLLDEFEKMHPNALNIFLSVLDEGFFTDGAGRKVSAQNVIIIATSNAGSDFIFEAVERGEDPSTRTDELVSKLIEQRIFKPELLNRFDGVIVFRPLGPEELRGIARILLAGLARELTEKGVTLEITEEIVAFLAEKGFDPKFGARPMRRALQEHIEEPIARKLIAGELRPGTTLLLTPETLR